jgi:hypothetical protein
VHRERPCDCSACAARRLAWRLFLACFAILALFGFLHRNDGRDRLLVQATPSAYVDQCGKVHRDLLDPRPGEPMFPIKRRGSNA